MVCRVNGWVILSHSSVNVAGIHGPTFTLEPCNFTLNIFPDFTCTHFKQERQCTRSYPVVVYLTVNIA